jgi:hypothetical protein
MAGHIVHPHYSEDDGDMSSGDHDGDDNQRC